MRSSLQKKFFLLILFLGVFGLAENSHAACTGASPTWTTTPDYASVSSCVSQATAGDMVNVSAGSATWSSQLKITKGINLIGAGDGVTYGAGTVITTTYTGTTLYSSAGFAVAYSPDSADRTTGFRLSGFEFDFSGASQGIGIWNELSTQWTNTVTSVRVDHNILKNANQEWMIIGGVVYGVADHNIIDHTVVGSGVDAIDHMGIGASAWQNLGYTLGQAETWFWEDNIFKASSGYSGDNWDCTNGARYVARYNTIQHTGSAAGSPIWDMHGNQGDSTQSCMGVEIYRNTVAAGSGTTYILQQRGGQSVVFDNTLSRSGTSVGLVQANEFGNSPTSNIGCDNVSSVPFNLVTGQPQHMSGSYFLNNVATAEPNVLKWGKGCILGYSGSGCTGANYCCATAFAPNRNVPAEELDFWGQYPASGTIETFTGARGIGRGTKAQMNTITTCAQGVGYWVTDEGTWNQSGSGEQGQLYQCGSSNNWVLFYTPYTYPHPLTLSVDTTPPANPSGLSVS